MARANRQQVFGRHRSQFFDDGWLRGEAQETLPRNAEKHLSSHSFIGHQRCNGHASSSKPFAECFPTNCYFSYLIGPGRCTCHVFRSVTASGLCIELQSNQPLGQHDIQHFRGRYTWLVLSLPDAWLQSSASKHRPTGLSTTARKVWAYKHFVL